MTLERYVHHGLFLERSAHHVLTRRDLHPAMRLGPDNAYPALSVNLNVRYSTTGFVLRTPQSNRTARREERVRTSYRSVFRVNYFRIAYDIQGN